MWSRTLASAARSDEHVAALRGLLDGSRTVEGLVVDTDARWSFLHGLVAIGAAGDAEIDAEAERDATATGIRRAATARALRPTAESKAETWRQSFHDDEVPNAVHEAIVAGFWHPAQRELTAPYVDRYFVDIRPDLGPAPGRDREERRPVPLPVRGGAAHPRRGGRLAGRRESAGGAAAAGVRGPGRHRPRTARPRAGRRSRPLRTETTKAPPPDVGGGAFERAA